MLSEILKICDDLSDISFSDIMNHIEPTVWKFSQFYHVIIKTNCLHFGDVLILTGRHYFLAVMQL